MCVLIARGERGLEVEQVGRGLKQRTRQLLQLRMPVHFQRVELVVGQPLRFTVRTVVQTALGFDVETAQLVAHALQRGLHLIERDVAIVDLLLDTAANHRGFARQVNHVFQQLGRHLDGVQPGALAFGHRRGTGFGLARRGGLGRLRV